jgi:hypothetical protein
VVAVEFIGLLTAVIYLLKALVEFLVAIRKEKK